MAKNYQWQISEKYLSKLIILIKLGDTITITVIRNDEPVDLGLQLYARKNKHVFSVNENATEKEIELRNAWMRNLIEIKRLKD